MAPDGTISDIKMGSLCQALAVSTGEKCKRKSLRGSRYCFFHVEKTPLLLSVGLGALLSLGAAEGYRWLVPSDEARKMETTNRELVAARGELQDLQQRHENAKSERAKLEGHVEALEQQLSVESEAARSQRNEHAKQLQGIQKQLEPFINLARKEYPDTSSDEALEMLRDEMVALRDQADKLERRTAPRSVSAEQIVMIKNRLRAAGQARLLVQYDPTDIEAKTLGQQLASAVQNAGWEVKTFELMAIGPIPGLHVFIKENRESENVGRKLYTALESAGLSPELGLSKSQGDWKVKLYVGPKPQ